MSDTNNVNGQGTDTADSKAAAKAAKAAARAAAKAAKAAAEETVEDRVNDILDGIDGIEPEAMLDFVMGRVDADELDKTKTTLKSRAGTATLSGWSFTDSVEGAVQEAKAGIKVQAAKSVLGGAKRS